MFHSRHVAAAAVLVISTAMMASPAWAAAPTNDTSPGATSATVGFSQVLDTTEATTDAEDAQLNGDLRGTGHGRQRLVHRRAGTGAGMVVDVSGSDYSAGVLVGAGLPGSLETVACGAGRWASSREYGTTYYVLAIDDQEGREPETGSPSTSRSTRRPAPHSRRHRQLQKAPSHGHRRRPPAAAPTPAPTRTSSTSSGTSPSRWVASPSRDPSRSSTSRTCDGAREPGRRTSPRITASSPVERR